MFKKPPSPAPPPMDFLFTISSFSHPCFLPLMNRSQVERAVKALYLHIEEQSSSKKSTKEPNDLSIPNPYEYIWVVLTTKKMHKSFANPHPIHLPHSFRTAEFQNNDVCLLVKSPASQIETLLQERGICGISKVIDLDTLRSTYGQFEARRALCDAYDLFLADDRIIPSLGKALGKKFFQKKKQPIAVKISESSKTTKKVEVEMEIQKALESTVFIPSAGSTSHLIRTSISALSQSQTVDNLIAVVEGVCQRLGGSVEEIVQSVHVKTADSPAFMAFLMADEVLEVPSKEQE